MTEVEKKALNALCADSKGVDWYSLSRAKTFLREHGLADYKDEQLNTLIDDYVEVHDCL